ncbi:MAG: prepilin-type N-terminal cleavage/methylation domain-containing protein [Marinobacterium sp.]|nr:prepilin-type N-terminal cleavage/methylation domain-containing protein [Marinobacterium sp.]
MSTNTKRQKGFTLVEIAIVMVIIGLLLGGALKGQEMIENARTKRVKADFDQILAAFFSYQDIYRALPGDNPNASVQHNNNQLGNGDGRSTVNNNWGSTTDDQETRLFWEHLREADLIAGAGQDQPQNAFGGIIGVQNDVGPNANQMNGLSMCFSNLDSDVTRIIDNQYDDGNGTTGTYRVIQAAGNARNTNVDSGFNNHTAGVEQVLCIQM